MKTSALPFPSSRRPLLLPVMGLLLAAVCLVPPVSADIILLTNGKTLEGNLEELGNGKVRVRLAYGSLSFSEDQIASVHAARTFEEIVTENLETLADDDAEGRFRLAQNARREQSHTLYRHLLEEVVAIDPDHEAARQELGYVPFNGEWVTMDQLHELRGEVRFRGEWMAPQTRDRILLAETEAKQAARDRREAQVAARRQREEAEAAARREAQAQAQAARRPAAYSGFWQPGCNFGITGSSFYGGPYGGAYSTGPAYQPLQPFQPGQIQVPNQTYRYSLHQTVRVRPGRSPRPYVGYRADPPPPRRR